MLAEFIDLVLVCRFEVVDATKTLSKQMRTSEMQRMTRGVCKSLLLCLLIQFGSIFVKYPRVGLLMCRQKADIVDLSPSSLRESRSGREGSGDMPAM